MNKIESAEASPQKHTLSNGLTLLLDPDSRFSTTSFGICILGGLRDEPSEKLGITHLLEHLLFKRTKTKDVRQIAALMDSFGSGIEAFTDADSLCLQATVAQGEVRELIAFIAELLCQTAFNEQDLERERGVVRQEILDCEDDPGEIVFQELSKRFWPSDVLRHPVFGELATVDSITLDQLYARLKQLLVGRRIIIGLSGAFAVDAVKEQVTDLFAKLPEGARPPRVPAKTSAGTSVLARPFNQVYFALACPWPAELDSNYLAGQLLSFVLGEAMSSRLFQVIREQEGLLYDIGSGVDAFATTAMLVVSGAVERKRFLKVIDLVLGEIQKVREHQITASELEEAKRHFSSQYLLEADCLGSRLWRAIETESMYERYVSVKESKKKVESITSGSILTLVEEWLPALQSSKSKPQPSPESKNSNAKLSAQFTFSVGGDVEGLKLPKNLLDLCGGEIQLERK